MVWKYIPTKIGILDRKTGKFHVDAPVTGVKLHAPGHSGSAIRSDWHAAEIQTPYGKRWYGFAAGCISPSLKMAVKLGPGQERDEVVAKWKNAPANVCGRPIGRARRRKKRR